MTENAKEMSDPHPSLPEAAGTGRGETALSADAIVEYVRQEEHFPPNCDALWALNPLVEGSGQRLISYVLWRLGTSALKGAVLLDPTPRFQGVADRFWPAMVAGLFEAGQSNADLLNAAVEFLRVMPPDELCALLHSQGQAVRQFYPKSNRALGLRLGEVLDSLREGPEQFRWRLRLLAQWKDWFEDRSEAERRLGQWQRFCNAMAEVARIREVEKRLKKLAWINWFGWLGRKKDYQDVMPKLAARIREAISRQASPADPDPELATIWRRAGAALLDDAEFWESNVAWTVDQYLLGRCRLPREPFLLQPVVRGTSSKKVRAAPAWVPWTAVAAVVLLMLVCGLWNGLGPSDSPKLAEEPSSEQPPREDIPPGKAGAAKTKTAGGATAKPLAKNPAGPDENKSPAAKSTARPSAGNASGPPANVENPKSNGKLASKPSPDARQPIMPEEDPRTPPNQPNLKAETSRSLKGEDEGNVSPAAEIEKPHALNYLRSCVPILGAGNRNRTGEPVTITQLKAGGNPRLVLHGLPKEFAWKERSGELLVFFEEFEKPQARVFISPSRAVCFQWLVAELRPGVDRLSECVVEVKKDGIRIRRIVERSALL